VIELLPNENKRDGTVEVGDFNRLLTKFDDIDVRDLVEFLYAAGWRVTRREARKIRCGLPAGNGQSPRCSVEEQATDAAFVQTVPDNAGNFAQTAREAPARLQVHFS
jgi:hypothetical protein